MPSPCFKSYQGSCSLRKTTWNSLLTCACPQHLQVSLWARAFLLKGYGCQNLHYVHLQTSTCTLTIYSHPSPAKAKSPSLPKLLPRDKTPWMAAAHTMSYLMEFHEDQPQQVIMWMAVPQNCCNGRQTWRAGIHSPVPRRDCLMGDCQCCLLKTGWTKKQQNWQSQR